MSIYDNTEDAIALKKARLKKYTTKKQRTGIELTKEEYNTANGLLDEIKELQETRGRDGGFEMDNTATMAKPWRQEQRGDGNFSSFGEYLLAVRDAYMPGNNRRDARLEKPEYSGTRESRAITGMSEKYLQDGGFLVGEQFENKIIGRVYEENKLINLLDHMQITEPGKSSIKIPMVDETSRANGSRFGGIRGYVPMASCMATCR